MSTFTELKETNSLWSLLYIELRYELYRELDNMKKIIHMEPQMDNESWNSVSNELYNSLEDAVDDLLWNNETYSELCSSKYVGLRSELFIALGNELCRELKILEGIAISGFPSL